MDTRRLETLVTLARLGSMRAVAEATHTTTSTVSQQVATLAREVGTALVEPDGRRVRFTPAGRRLAEHAITILAAVEAARRDLDPASPPAGTVRVAGFATAIRRFLLPVAAELAVTHPRVRVVVHEYEPGEAVAGLLADELDLALTYDFDLAPAETDPVLTARPVWWRRWGLGVPAGDPTADRAVGPSPRVLAAFADRDWIGNSRNPADEAVLRLFASLAGIEPRLTHEADSLDLVDALIVAGLGVGLLPVDRPVADGVRVLALDEPPVWMRALAVTRRGADAWPPLALVLDRVTRHSRAMSAG